MHMARSREGKRAMKKRLAAKVDFTRSQRAGIKRPGIKPFHAIKAASA